MELNVLKSSESENHVLTIVQCVWARHSYQQNSKNNNNRRFKFNTLYLHHVEMLSKTFSEDPLNNLCTGIHKRILILFRLWAKFNLRFSIFRVLLWNRTCVFLCSKNISFRMIKISFTIFIQGFTKKFEHNSSYAWKWLEGDTSCFMQFI